MLKAVSTSGGDSGGGVSSLNGETGALSLTSTGGTVTISASGSNINLEASGGIGANLTATLTANGTIVLPAKTYISNIVVQETAGHAVTGGLNFGTTSLASDIFLALPVGSDSLQSVDQSSLSKSIFSSSTTQTIFISAVTAWNSASVNFTITYVDF
jgi:hypothetical protein